MRFREKDDQKNWLVVVKLGHDLREEFRVWQKLYLVLKEGYIGEICHEATRKVVFHERCSREHVASGLKGGPMSFERTRFKSHEGRGSLI